MLKSYFFIFIFIVFSALKINALPEWEPVLYSATTSINAQVTIDGNPASQGDKVGAFFMNECRAIFDIKIVDGKSYIMGEIYGNNKFPVTFKLWNSKLDEIYHIAFLPVLNPGNSIHADSDLVINAITNNEPPQFFEIPDFYMNEEAIILPGYSLNDRTSDDKTLSQNLQWTVTNNKYINAIINESNQLLLSFIDKDKKGTDTLILTVTDEDGLSNIYDLIIGIQKKENPNIKPALLTGFPDTLFISNVDEEKVVPNNYYSNESLFVGFGYYCENFQTIGISPFNIKLTMNDEIIWTGDGNTENVQANGVGAVWNIFIPALAEGNYTFKVELDSDNQIIETDESDNVISKTITVKHTDEPYPDPNLKEYIPEGETTGIEIEDMSDIYNSEGIIILNFYIQNSTRIDITLDDIFFIEVYIDDYLEYTVPYYSSIKGKNYGYVQDIMIDNLAPGEHTVKIIIDTDNTIKESNEEDNEFSHTFILEGEIPGPKPDKDILEDITGVCSAKIKTIPTATDKNGSSIFASYDGPLEFDRSQIVQWVYLGSDGGQTKQDQNVVIEDKNEPELVCPENKTILLAPGEKTYSSYDEEFDPLLVNDNCGIEFVINNLNDSESLNGFDFHLPDLAQETNAIYEINWTAQDINKNVSSCIFEVMIKKASSINNEIPKSISIHPNPTNGLIHIEGNLNGISDIQIRDCSGKQILSQRATKHVINIEHLAPGIYYLSAVTSQGILNKKIIKK